ncbi:MAG: amidohydrolase [Planctomycetes bacterium]|nr:amidohydrolase [Planctomycetota bacterium]
MKLLHVLAPLLAAFVSTCASVSSAPPPPATLIHNGRIYLGAPRWLAVEALLVSEGRVVAAGSVRELEGAPWRITERMDLRGAVALPGLQDAHGHVEGLGESLETVDLRGAASYEELIARVVERARVTPEGEWIRGRGWDQNLWPSREFPHHAALSAATPRHPVLLERVDGHASFANAAALRAAGLDRAFAGEDELAGGRVLLDAERRPTGVFVDTAMGLLDKHAPAPSAAVRERRWLAAEALLLELGITCAHDMGVSPTTVELLARLRDEGRLKLRLVEYLAGGVGMNAQDVQGFPLAPDALDRLSVPGVKLYADGALGSRGAALLEPYHDEPGQRGLMVMSPEELRAALAVCAGAGLQPAVHAIGDRANRVVLDLFEERVRADASFRALRPRVEHAQVVARADWPRFDALGVIASMQPTHATSDMPWAPRRLGPERIDGAYAWRELVGDPHQLAFGSDFPVERPHPFEGLYAAITCATPSGEPPDGFRPDQRLTAAEALSAFTWGAARAAHQEARRGRLEPGYFADLTVVDLDPLAVEPVQLLRARVLATIINGEVVYRAPSGD